jgi:hypothetical protein
MGKPASDRERALLAHLGTITDRVPSARNNERPIVAEVMK